jgi:hypothetical protein
LGSLEWTVVAFNSIEAFRTFDVNNSVPQPWGKLNNAIIPLYSQKANFTQLQSTDDKVFTLNGVGHIENTFAIRDSSYTDATSFKQAMQEQGIKLYYELAEPIIEDLDIEFTPYYEIWDFGTEEAIASGASALFRADIVYQFNAVDRIRNNSTKIEELGTNVYEVIPIKKKVDPNAETPVSADSDNPLAGMELYCFFGYDTFPEKAAQLALDGIILEEPKDPNERNRYNVLSIGRLDGDTRQLEVLFREAENFYMNDQYVYTRQTDANGNFVLYGSSLDQINFQPIDLEMVGGEITPYEDGFYFLCPESWDVCWYQDGEITELPIVSNTFIRWRDQLIYNDMHWTEGKKNGQMKSYDVNTGDIRDLGISSTLAFSILGDRYLICEQDTEECIIDILLDLETGEQKELYRMES